MLDLTFIQHLSDIVPCDSHVEADYWLVKARSCDQLHSSFLSLPVRILSHCRYSSTSTSYKIDRQEKINVACNSPAGNVSWEFRGPLQIFHICRKSPKHIRHLLRESRRGNNQGSGSEFYILLTKTSISRVGLISHRRVSASSFMCHHVSYGTWRRTHSSLVCPSPSSYFFFIYNSPSPG